MPDMQALENLLLTITRDKIIMKFKSVSVNNCYILDEEVFDNTFFTYLNAKAIYSASVFHLAFFKGNITLLTEEEIKNYEKLSIDLYRLNSPYLYIPFEINFHENILYQTYYESDHFPLSLWIEEKSLIPFNILIKIIEDILKAFIVLEKAGHSHLFLTPEEILIPLQWKDDTHVKLYNLGINSIVKSVLSEKEIETYRNNYSKSSKLSVETQLVKNISYDIYSFGKILNVILPLCNFNNEKDKKIIKDNINLLTSNPDSFKSMNDVLDLFEYFLKEKNKQQTLNDNKIDYTYTGQASFDILEFNEWKEEAELVPLPEEDKEESQIKNLDKNTDFKHKSSIFKTVSSIFFNFFTRKNNQVSKTMTDFSEKSYETDTGKEITEKNNFNSNSEMSKETVTRDIFLTNNRKKAQQILIDIENHYRRSDKRDITDILSITKRNDLNSSKKKVHDNSFLESNKKDTISIFNNSLLERDYFRTYEIIKETKEKEKNLTKKDLTKELSNLLDNKLKQLDKHFVKSDSTDLLIKLAKLDSIIPNKGNEIDEDLIKNINNNLEIKTILSKNNDDISNENINLFKKILLYIKTKLNSLLNK